MVPPPPDRSLARREANTPLPPELILNDVLPPLPLWVRSSGLVLVVGLAAAVAAMAVWPYRMVVRGSGLVRPSGETRVINAAQGGVVRELLVQPNQSVKRGQQLVLLDPADLEGRQQALGQGLQGLKQQQQALQDQGVAAVGAAEQDVAKARAALQLAATEYARYRQLVASGAASVQQMQEKAAANSVATANLAQAERAVSQQRARTSAELAQLSRQLMSTRADQNQVNRDLRGTQVSAPVDGVVLSLGLRNPGQVVAKGEELARIAPSQSGLVARVLVPGQEIANLRKGQQAELKVAGCPYPDFGTLAAALIAVAPDASAPVTASGSYGFEVTLQPTRDMLLAGGRRCELRQGMELEAAITTRQETVLSFVLRKARLLVEQ
jgi:multidrug efflux pump subunit AcrA (membrane-fusion protein)